MRVAIRQKAKNLLHSLVELQNQDSPTKVHYHSYESKHNEFSCLIKPSMLSVRRFFEQKIRENERPTKEELEERVKKEAALRKEEREEAKRKHKKKAILSLHKETKYLSKQKPNKIYIYSIINNRNDFWHCFCALLI